MSEIESDRLRRRRLDAGDAVFILELLNEPGWLRHLRDKRVRDLGRAYPRRLGSPA